MDHRRHPKLLRITGRNAYGRLFKRGAMIVPRRCYFVEVPNGPVKPEGVYDISIDLDIANFSGSEWKQLRLQGRVEGKYLFRTAIDRQIAPFHILGTRLIALPLRVVSGNDGSSRYKLVDHDQLFAMGERNAGTWFRHIHNRWRNIKNRGAQSPIKTSNLDKLNRGSNLTSHDPSASFLVLYAETKTHSSAALVEVSDGVAFVADHTTFWCRVGSRDEGHYLAAYLNASFPSRLIKELRSRKLVNESGRLSILKLPFPRYSDKNPDHVRLAEIGAACAEFTAPYAQSLESSMPSSYVIRNYRQYIRQEAASRISLIDEILEPLMHRTPGALRR